MRKQYLILFILLLVLSGASYFVYTSHTLTAITSVFRPSPYKNTVLRIGAITDSIKDSTDGYTLMKGYLKTKLGVKDVELVFARTALEMAVLLRQNKQDMIIENPFASFSLHSVAQTEAVLGTVENGESAYSSVFIVPQKSSIKNIADLVGKTIAFKEPESASSYFLPKADLIRRGFKVVEKEGPSSKVAADEIGYYFTGDNEVTIKHLYKGTSVAGAMSNSNYKEDSAEFDGYFKIIDTTESIAPHVVSFRKDFDLNLKQSVVSTLTSMHTDGAGKAAMDEIEVEQFVRLDQNPKLITNMEILSSQVQDETLTH